MKIACLGNMNNMLFQIGRYLIDEKHDVTFYLLDEFDHFLPEADTYENMSSFDLRNLGWNAETFLILKKREICNHFFNYDVLIGTDWAPAFLFKAGLKLDIYFPHGSDLYEYPFFKYKNHPPQLWEISSNIASRAQYFGIKEAVVVSLDSSDLVYEEPLRKIKRSSFERIVSPPYLYLKQYNNNYFFRSSFHETFQEIKSKYKFIAFQQISQDWSMRGIFKIDKGNDKLIIGFANYLKQNTANFNDSVLILMEYGGDVEKSKKLIEELGICRNVLWFKKMMRKDLMALISIADICVGELGYRAWYSYSSIMEFMAMKKPFLHHRNDSYYRSKGMDLYPMIDASTSEVVTRTFIDFRSDPMKYRIMGEQAYQWLVNDTDRKVKYFNEVISKSNHVKNINLFFLKWFYYKLNPHIIYNYTFLWVGKLKQKIKLSFA